MNQSNVRSSQWHSTDLAWKSVVLVAWLVVAGGDSSWKFIVSGEWWKCQQFPSKPQTTGGSTAPRNSTQRETKMSLSKAVRCVATPGKQGNASVKHEVISAVTVRAPLGKWGWCRPGSVMMSTANERRGLAQHTSHWCAEQWCGHQQSSARPVPYCPLLVPCWYPASAMWCALQCRESNAR